MKIRLVTDIEGDIIFFKGRIDISKSFVIASSRLLGFFRVEVVKSKALYYYNIQKHRMLNCASSPMKIRIYRFTREASYFINNEEIHERFKLEPFTQKNYKDILSVKIKQPNECINLLLNMLSKEDAEKVYILHYNKERHSREINANKLS